MSKKDESKMETGSDMTETENQASEPDLSAIGASTSPAWNKAILYQTVSSVAPLTWEENPTHAACDAGLAGLTEIAPKDALEAMLAAQMIATHNAAMECLRRSNLKGQNLQARQINLSMANKLSRTYASLLNAFDKHRGKGQQKMTVKHVHVNSGGQAIVGSFDRD